MAILAIMAVLAIGGSVSVAALLRSVAVVDFFNHL